MIRSMLIAFALAGLTPAALAQSDAVSAADAGETVVAKVNGMVCDFCAQAVTKVFGREDAVESVDVDLDNGEIKVAMKPGQTLDDAKIESLVRKSGYALVAVERPSA